MKIIKIKKKKSKTIKKEGKKKGKKKPESWVLKVALRPSGVLLVVSQVQMKKKETRKKKEKKVAGLVYTNVGRSPE